MTLVAKIIGARPTSYELVKQQWKLKCFHALFVGGTSSSNEIVGTVLEASFLPSTKFNTRRVWLFG